MEIRKGGFSHTKSVYLSILPITDNFANISEMLIVDRIYQVYLHVIRCEKKRGHVPIFILIVVF